MTLPSSGTLTTAQVSQEIYGNPNQLIIIPDATTRQLTGKPTGSLIFPDDFYGKTWGASSKILTVGNFSIRYGYETNTDGTPFFGSIDNDSVNWPAGSKINTLVNRQANVQDISLGITTPTSVTATQIRDNIRGLRIGANIYLTSDSNALIVIPSPTLFGIFWADNAVPNPMGTTIGATREVEILYF